MKQLLYEDFLIACEKIAKRIKKNHKDKIDSVYGISRGGLVPAVYLSHLLDVPVVEDDYIGEDTLIIDDICDTGQTLESYSYLGCVTATIYYHRKSIFEPDIWIYEKKDDWIKFPWETKESTVGDYER